MKFITIGDTHGAFNYIRYNIKHLCIENVDMFHVGDFGVGFSNNDSRELDNLNSFLESKNIILHVIRGNHDNPLFFNGNFIMSNLKLHKDYTVVDVNGDNILMVGGAISIDRKFRIDEMSRYKNVKRNIELHWPDEVFVLDEAKLSEFRDIKYIITHSAPHFVDPINGFGRLTHGPLVEDFSKDDPYLKAELDEERQNITRMYDILKENNNISKWFYGHFHRHNITKYDDTDFIMLDINEFFPVY